MALRSNVPSSGTWLNSIAAVAGPIPGIVRSRSSRSRHTGLLSMIWRWRLQTHDNADCHHNDARGEQDGLQAHAVSVWGRGFGAILRREELTRDTCAGRLTTTKVGRERHCNSVVWGHRSTL